MFINNALKSTEKMLKKTFETGISEEEYYVLLFLLYDVCMVLFLYSLGKYLILILIIKDI